MNDDLWRDFYATAPNTGEVEWNERLSAADEYLRTVKQFVRTVPKITPDVAKMLNDAYKQVEDIHGERREWLA